MQISFLHPIANDPPNARVVETPEVQDRLHNSMEGGEFLDDGLRMVDLPFRTEESIAAGTPEKFTLTKIK